MHQGTTSNFDILWTNRIGYSMALQALKHVVRVVNFQEFKLLRYFEFNFISLQHRSKEQ